jgi:hypothetical protein
MLGCVIGLQVWEVDRSGLRFEARVVRVSRVRITTHDCTGLLEKIIDGFRVVLRWCRVLFVVRGLWGVGRMVLRTGMLVARVSSRGCSTMRCAPAACRAAEVAAGVLTAVPFAGSSSDHASTISPSLPVHAPVPTTPLDPSAGTHDPPPTATDLEDLRAVSPPQTTSVTIETAAVWSLFRISLHEAQIAFTGFKVKLCDFANRLQHGEDTEDSLDGILRVTFPHTPGLDAPTTVKDVLLRNSSSWTLTKTCVRSPLRMYHPAQPSRPLRPPTPRATPVTTRTRGHRRG